MIPIIQTKERSGKFADRENYWCVIQHVNCFIFH